MSTVACLAAVCLLPIAVAAVELPPPNPHAPATTWPEGHGPYCQQSTPAPGPTAADAPQVVVLPIDNPRRGFLPTGTIVAAPDASGRTCCWGTNGKVIYAAVIAGGPPLLQVADPTLCGYDQVSGYWTMDARHVAYFLDASRQEIIALTHAVAGDCTSGFRVVARGPLPAGFLQRQHAPVAAMGLPERIMLRNDGLVGIKLLYSGELVVSSRYGKILVIDRDLRHPVVYDVGEPIDNSLAVDESGGIYLTTFGAVQRVRWDGRRITQDWSEPIGGRSGSTPTLMGCGANEDRLLAITAGDRPMQLILLWRDRVPVGAQRLAARVPVDYGDGPDAARATENSLLVHGHGVVVANWTGLFPRMQERRSGLARYDWDPARRSVTRIWANRDVSMPNSMQALSIASGLIYGVGVRAIGGADTYGMYGVRWADGAVDHFTPIGAMADRATNTVGSGIQIGPGRTIITMSPERLFLLRPAAM
jgi:hypothetical protein